ncbi:MAG: DMT family transporter [Lachnospiraceae bacterium]|nr:DMT family transporter [Lachnospiraceae bacterium]
MKLTNSHIKGILCIIAAAFGFSLMTFFIRLSGDLPTMQKAFFRNAFAAIITIVLLIKSKEKFHIKKESWGDLAFRCFFGTSGLICNFYAIDRLGIADANMLNKLSPFFAILLSIPLLKEVPTKLDIIATVIAFIGALFIIKPGGNLSVFPALVGLYGGFGAGVAYAFVRRLGRKGERTPIIVLCFSLFSCMVTAPFLIFDFHPMSVKQLLCLILAGVFASVGQFGITSAYKFAPAKEISVFDYTQVIFAALLGIIFLKETPGILSIIGYVIIIGMAFIRWNHSMKHSDSK